MTVHHTCPSCGARSELEELRQSARIRLRVTDRRIAPRRLGGPLALSGTLELLMAP
jgi:hypothetical protein